MTYSTCMCKWEVALALFQACNMLSYYMFPHGFGSMSSKRDSRMRVWAWSCSGPQGSSVPHHEGSSSLWSLSACLDTTPLPEKCKKHAEKHPPVSPRCLGGRRAKCDFLTSPAWGWDECTEPPLLVAAAEVCCCPGLDHCLGGKLGQEGHRFLADAWWVAGKRAKAGEHVWLNAARTIFCPQPSSCAVINTSQVGVHLQSSLVLSASVVRMTPNTCKKPQNQIIPQPKPHWVPVDIPVSDLRTKLFPLLFLCLLSFAEEPKARTSTQSSPCEFCGS